MNIVLNKYQWLVLIGCLTASKSLLLRWSLALSKQLSFTTNKHTFSGPFSAPVLQQVFLGGILLMLVVVL